MKFKLRELLISLLAIAITFSSTYAFDRAILVEPLRGEIKRSAINRDVAVGEIRFIGFAPTENCIPEKIKLREIRRPSSVEFTFFCGGRLYRAVAEYEVLTSIYVTQRTIKRGEQINEEDLLEIKKPLSRVPAGAVRDKSEIVGRVMKRTVAQGVVIKDDHLHIGTPVKRGSTVWVLVSSSGVTIMTEGVLKNDSTVGESARVQLLQTGKEIVGKLVEKDKVRVEL